MNENKVSLDLHITVTSDVAYNIGRTLRLGGMTKFAACAKHAAQHGTSFTQFEDDLQDAFALTKAGINIQKQSGLPLNFNKRREQIHNP